ncbi:MAG: phosphoribosylanthranilate isomerase [Flavobacteriaceae bacterium]|jgi:phosphoribosylanthranilate isomerase|nr:N-(5'-phosphoribosyl)anthranilate isomerase [Flavobacteriaceae bacterium]|tara:strand:+ start:1144 stop:1755 length:612 start_codon:yes stop_codon:yes gene_type:complete
MKLKVCGMQETENIAALASLQPDYMGFIFWEPSKRYCTTVPTDIPKHIKKVGVFVDETTKQIKEKVKLFGLDAVQLHGDESPRQCAALLNLCEVIKAFRIGPDFDFKTLTPYQDHCTYFLFDTQGPLPGGNGTAFDWKLLAGYTLDTPFFLSGGIGLGHVEAIAEIRKRNLPIHALDINSQFESKPGVKKIEKIEKFKQLVQL